jgi:hypothetical protein
MLDDIRKKTQSGIDSISKQSPDEIGAAVIGKARSSRTAIQARRRDIGVERGGSGAPDG